MRIRCRAILSFGLAGLLVGPALAQRGGGPGGGPSHYGGITLLQSKSVQEELKLAPDQIQKIREIPQSIYDKHREELEAAQKLEGEARRERVPKILLTINDEASKAQEELLNPQQKNRLKEITVQQSGPRAFLDQEVQKTLNLTDEQKDKIKTINENFQKQEFEIFPRRGGGRASPGRGGYQERFEKSDALRKESVDKILAILTDDQKKKYKEMTGMPFELKRAAQPSERPGRGQENPNK
jgi:Spy/CpxP family protein refolding chaperone